MATIVFTENDTMVAVTAFDATGVLWRDSSPKVALARWWRAALADRRIGRSDRLFCVLPETMVARTLLALPTALQSSARRRMAESALVPQLGARPTDGRCTLVCALDEGQGLYAVQGFYPTALREWRAMLGRYGRSLQFVSAAQWQLWQSAPPADGYFEAATAQWTAVMAVKDGEIIDSRCSLMEPGQALYHSLHQAHAAFPALALPQGVQPMPVADVDALPRFPEASAAPSWRTAWQGDRVLAALVLGGVVLPGLLLVASAFRPATEEATPEQAAQMPTRSDYHTLLDSAYVAKSERVTLRQHEAEGDHLAVSGECVEALDVADYMKSLAADTRPQLLALNRVSEDKRTYYTFTIQLSNEGGDAQ